MLRVAIPYGTLNSRADAQARRTSRASTTAATATSPPGRTSSTTGSSWRKRPTSSPSWPRSRCTRSRPAANRIRNISRRPVRRRRRRRDHRPAPVGRDDPADDHVHARIQLPAAQVQDRGDRHARPTARRCAGTISRCGSSRTTPARSASRSTPAAAWAAPRSSPTRSATSCRPSQILSYLQAVLRVWNRNARRDNIHKQRMKILVHELGEDEFRRQVEEEFAALPDARARLPAGRVRPHRRLLRAAAVRDRPQRRDRPLRSRLRAVGRPPGRRAQGAGLRDRQHQPEADRPDPRRHLAPSRWTSSPISPSATASTSCARRTRRTWSCRTSASRTSTRCGPRSTTPGLGEANLDLVTDIIACPGLDYCSLANARSIPLAQKLVRALRRSGAAAGPRRAEDQDLGLHQRLRPPPRGQHRHPRRRPEGQRELPAAARRLGRRGHHAGQDRRPRLRRGRRSSTRSSARSSATATMREPGERFIDTYRRVGMDGFKEAIYGLMARCASATIRCPTSPRSVARRVPRPVERRLGAASRRATTCAAWRPVLDRVRLVEVDFPKFRDGRGFSSARGSCARRATPARSRRPATCWSTSSTSCAAAASTASRPTCRSTTPTCRRR